MIRHRVFSRALDFAGDVVGAVPDSRFKWWGKIITSVDQNVSNGYAFVGDWLLDGSVEFDAEKVVLLVSFAHGSRRYSTREYVVLVYDPVADVFEDPGIHTDDSSPGWALRIRDQVAQLLNTLMAHPLPDVVISLAALCRDEAAGLSDSELQARIGAILQSFGFEV